jgi:hypothetical protein
VRIEFELPALLSSVAAAASLQELLAKRIGRSKAPQATAGAGRASAVCVDINEIRYFF